MHSQSKSITAQVGIAANQQKHTSEINPVMCSKANNITLTKFLDVSLIESKARSSI
jgi:hypothetical protein